jgi:hypothetical protein
VQAILIDPVKATTAHSDGSGGFAELDPATVYFSEESILASAEIRARSTRH